MRQPTNREEPRVTDTQRYIRIANLHDKAMAARLILSALERDHDLLAVTRAEIRADTERYGPRVIENVLGRVVSCFLSATGASHDEQKRERWAERYTEYLTKLLDELGELCQ